MKRSDYNSNWEKPDYIPFDELDPEEPMNAGDWCVYMVCDPSVNDKFFRMMGSISLETESQLFVTVFHIEKDWYGETIIQDGIQLQDPNTTPTIELTKGNATAKADYAKTGVVKHYKAFPLDPQSRANAGIEKKLTDTIEKYFGKDARPFAVLIHRRRLKEIPTQKEIQKALNASREKNENN